MGRLNKLKAHVPGKVLENNPHMENFLLVLQGMQTMREDEIERYVRSFYFPLVTDIKTVKKYIDEWGAEYTEGSTLKSLVCLYNNYYNIYAYKGTKFGLKKVLECLFTRDQTPVITINGFSMGKPLILSDKDRPYDFIPNGADIAAEVNPGTNPVKWCPTLLGGSWADTKATINIDIDCNFVPDATFMEFIKEVIVLYVPMMTKENLIFTLNVI